MTHTYTTLPVSERAYNEIAEKLSGMGYNENFVENGLIDMYGIALEKIDVKDHQPDCMAPQGYVCSCKLKGALDDKTPLERMDDYRHQQGEI